VDEIQRRAPTMINVLYYVSTGESQMEKLTRPQEQYATRIIPMCMYPIK
jgi:hypothetical protein